MRGRLSPSALFSEAAFADADARGRNTIRRARRRIERERGGISFDRISLVQGTTVDGEREKEVENVVLGCESR